MPPQFDGGKGLRRISWEDLRATGALLVVNQILHTYGLALTVQVEEDGSISDAYPTRCRLRGFPQPYQDEEYSKLARYLAANAEQLVEDTEQQ
jgi:hypothetical protein